MTKDRLQTYDTYDPKDIIKDIELGTLYITSLQNILSDMIINEGHIDTVGETFQKFEKIKEHQQKGTDESKELFEELSNWEKKVFTLFSLLQVLKYKALKQGLAKPSNVTIDKDAIGKISDMIKEGKDVTESILKVANSKKSS